MLQSVDEKPELACQIEAGDRLAEVEFVETYSHSLMLMLLKKTRDPEIAKDCCQKTLLIALNKMRAGEIMQPERLLAFLRCTAANVAVTHFRTEKRYTCLGDNVFKLRSEAGDSAVQAIDLDTIRCLLNKLLDQLKVPRDKEILRRFYLQEEEKLSICRDFGIKSEHFDRVLYRAKHRVRRILKNHHDVEQKLYTCLDTGRREAGISSAC